MAQRAIAAAVIPRALVEDARSTVLGIGFAVLANLMWTLGDTAAKWAIPVAGVGGAMLWRGVFGAVVVAGVAATQDDGMRRIIPVRWGLVTLRSVLSAFVSITWYVSWRKMSLADTYALGFTAPLLMTLMAVPMLGERIRWRRMLSTLFGFAGVLVMLRPGGDLWRPETLLLMVGIVVMALTRIMTRQLSTTETPECQAFSLMVGHLCTGAAIARRGADARRADAGGVGRAGVPRPDVGAGALRLCAGIRLGTDLGTGAVRLYGADLGRPGGLARLRGGTGVEHDRRSGDRRGSGAVQPAPRTGAGGRIRAMNRLAGLALLLLGAIQAAGAAPDPFAAPVKDCHPCHIAPGPGQPAFDLNFVFAGAGDGRTLIGFDISRAGGTTQRLRFNPVAASDFPDGFILDTADMNFDGLADLALTTLVAADNTDVAYWVYQPATGRFVPLRRMNDGDANETVLQRLPDHMLICHEKGSAVEWTDYRYRVSGDRAVAVVRQTQAIDNGLVVQASYDLTVSPPRMVRRATVGFAGDSPQRRAFLQRFALASKRAAALYRHGDAKAAAAELGPVLKGMELALLPGSYPVTDDPADLRLVGAFNDYGFYLEQAGRVRDAIGVLSAVTDIDPNRTVAWLNLADAAYAAGQLADAKQSYAEYRQRMEQAGRSARIPARVLERLRWK